MKDLDTETVETEPVHTGAKPILRRLKTPADRNQAIATWIQQVLRELRLSRSCAAILCPTKKCVEEMLKSMNDLKLPSVRFRDDTKNLDKPAVKVMTVHSCKGLEFPVVVIPDFRADAFGWLERGDSQAAEETARRIYFVACTRAMKRLLVTRVGDGEDNLTKQLTADNWNMEK
jgi:superfamily I DNA/RNA helicase